MARYKTFVADGTIPNGRLYAGDLNGIQDMFTPFSDFNTTLDVGVLRVGDPTLQLLKYGTGEFRMSGSMRFDGIMRALGGMLAGAFTTTQRDSIPAGSRPFSLIIFNTTTNRYECNLGTDAAPNWQPMSGVIGPPPPGEGHASAHLPSGSDPMAWASTINKAGPRSGKGGASAANAGLLYFETDWNQLWRSDGSQWVRAALFPRNCTISQFGGLPDFADGDEVFLEVSSGVRWHLRYNTSGGTHKWEFVGGPGVTAKDDSTSGLSGTSYQFIGPTVQIPRAGTYDVRIEAVVGADTVAPTVYNHAWISFGGPGVSVSDANGAASTHIGTYTVMWGLSRTSRVTFSGAGSVSVYGRGHSADAIDIRQKSIYIHPAAIS